MTRFRLVPLLISGLFAVAFVAGAGAQDKQYGGKRKDFEVGRAKAFVIHPPDLPKDGSRPWVWYAPTIGGHPNAGNGWVLERLLAKGFTVAGVNAGESYGSPAGRKVFADFYDHVVKEYKLDAKANLLAQSRGGLMHYNWAVENPEKVRAIVGIYPVCDLRSYPGLKTAAGAYGLTPAELEKQLAGHNPIDRLAPLAKAKVPILHVHGDSDKVVPLEANSKALADRYAALGGPARLIVVPGKGHAEIAEFFQEPRVVQFFIDAKLPEAKTPAGLRVAYALMSNGAEVEAVVKAAGIAGHKQANAPYFGTWHGFVGGGRDGIPKKARELIARGGIDALTVATWSWAPNAETWHNRVGLDSALAGVAALGLEKNSNFRLCWRAFLKPHTFKKGDTVVPDFAATRKTLEKEIKELQAHVDTVNKKHGKRVVLIVPHAQAGLALVDLVAAGKFPGVKDPADLWMKEEAFNMNVHRHLRALAAYCDFAVIYGISPEGLKPSFMGITYKSKGSQDHSMEGITDEQHAILQKIAWETVSKYPHAGTAR